MYKIRRLLPLKFKLSNHTRKFKFKYRMMYGEIINPNSKRTYKPNFNFQGKTNENTGIY